MKKIVILVLALFLHSSSFAQLGAISVEQPIIVGTDTISGTLVSPFDLKSRRKTKKTPLVIFIPGSGPTDRDGNSALAKGENNCFQQLADSLLKVGIATYRYDKLGIGKSSKIVDESTISFDDNVKVVEAIFNHLNKELGFKDIFIMGHSEGSLIGMLAAQKLDLSGYISLAGPAENAHDILVYQVSNAPSMPENLKSEVIEKLDSLHAGNKVEQVNPMLASLLRKPLQPYLINWFKYTPKEEIAKIDCEVLIIQGGRDIQVETKEGESLHKAAPKAAYQYYATMNHVLKIVDEGREQNLAAYNDPDFRFPQTLVTNLAEWIKKNS